MNGRRRWIPLAPGSLLDSLVLGICLGHRMGTVSSIYLTRACSSVDGTALAWPHTFDACSNARRVVIHRKMQCFGVSPSSSARGGNRSGPACPPDQCNDVTSPQNTALRHHPLFSRRWHCRSQSVPDTGVRISASRAHLDLESVRRDRLAIVPSSDTST